MTTIWNTLFIRSSILRPLPSVSCASVVTYPAYITPRRSLSCRREIHATSFKPQKQAFMRRITHSGDTIDFYVTNGRQGKWHSAGSVHERGIPLSRPVLAKCSPKLACTTPCLRKRKPSSLSNASATENASPDPQVNSAPFTCRVQVVVRLALHSRLDLCRLTVPACT